MSIRKRIENLRSALPSHVQLVAISKNRSIEEIMEAYHSGQRFFGENRAQELIIKQPQLPGDIQWHFVGHLQSNKVKYIAPFASMIHSIDSLKLLAEVNREAAKNGRIIDCLLQFHVAREETKYGLSLDEAIIILNSDDYSQMQSIRICGVMGMASYIEDMGVVRSEFRELHSIFMKLKEQFFSRDDAFRELSMGMSHDYLIAVEEGSTLVRIGTALFE